MADKSKTGEGFTKMGVCAVCYLVWGDKRKKPVKYCSTCDACICEICWSNYLMRFMAYVKSKFRDLPPEARKCK